jgi:hypothetical protein
VGDLEAGEAVVEQGYFFHPGPPMVRANERAIVPCGCAAYVGVRLDNGEMFLGATACSAEHEPKVGQFLAAYHESLDNPTDRLAVEVADEILMMVFARG